MNEYIPEFLKAITRTFFLLVLVAAVSHIYGNWGLFSNCDSGPVNHIMQAFYLRVLKNIRYKSFCLSDACWFMFCNSIPGKATTCRVNSSIHNNVVFAFVTLNKCHLHCTRACSLLKWWLFKTNSRTMNTVLLALLVFHEIATVRGQELNSNRHTFLVFGPIKTSC